MNTRLGISLGALCFAAVTLSASRLSAQMPPAIIVSGETIVTTFHAEGAQIYECKHDPGNKLFWMLREPVAALIVDGKTAGFHAAGPNWQHIDGSSVRANGERCPRHIRDIPWPA